VGQGDPGCQHQNGVGAIRRRLCCGAQAMSGAGHQEPLRDVRNHGSFSWKRPCVSMVRPHQKAAHFGESGQ
jgi:hypothetical protein